MYYLRYLCLFVHSGIQHIFTIRVTWQVSCWSHRLLVHRGCLGSPPVFGGVCVAHLISFLYCVFFSLSSSCVLWTQCTKFLCHFTFLIAPSHFFNIYILLHLTLNNNKPINHQNISNNKTYITLSHQTFIFVHFFSN